VTTRTLVSGGTPVTVTIARNHIFDNAIGIWLSKVVTAFGLPTDEHLHERDHADLGEPLSPRRTTGNAICDRRRLILVTFAGCRFVWARMTRRSANYLVTALDVIRRRAR
jgi:hypothetical protein